MLDLAFQGFFQCRLATDSDSYDDPRGSLGWTFALGNEPDLDRIIRFNDPVALRTHAPEIGVRVASVNGSTAAHPLLGARVDLDPNSTFEGRNGAVAGAGREPVHPAVWTISGNGVSLRRQSDYNVLKPVQRAPYLGRGVGPLPEPGIRGMQLSTDQSALQFRAERRVALEADLAAAQDPAAREILQRRIKYLETQNAGIVPGSLLIAVSYAHTLKDAAAVTDPNGALGVKVDTKQPWRIEYWMGSFDADTLTGYVRGTLSIPTS